MFWDPQSVKTGCNDVTDRNIPFYVANGKMENEEQFQSEIGEYKLNIVDESWTAVDWQNLTHHDTSTDGAFLAGNDCVVGSTSSTAVGNRYGCITSTNHGTDGGGRERTPAIAIASRRLCRLRATRSIPSPLWRATFPRPA